MEDELFEIKINEQGKDQLLRMRFWVKFFYVCTILTLIFDLINGFISLKNYSRFESSLMPLLKFQYLFNITFLFVYAIMLPLQAWFFYRFSSRATEAIQYGNSEGFNASFYWLLKHAMIAGILFALNTLAAISLTLTELRLNAMRF